MKKIKKISFLLLLAISAVCCKHKAEEEIKIYKPIIKFIEGPTFVYEDTSMPCSNAFYVSVNIYKNAKSDKKIKNFKILRIFGTDTTVAIDSTINIENEIYSYSFLSNSETGTEQWLFTATDEQEKESNIGFTITTQHYYPQLTVIFEHNSVPVAGEIKFAINAKSNETSNEVLNNIKIKRDFNNVATPLLDSNLLCQEFIMFSTYTAEIEEGSETWEFNLTDAAGETTTLVAYINTVIFLDEEHYGGIWNLMSPNNNAWDLVNNIARTQSDIDDVKDMENLSDSSITFTPYYFLNSWTAANATLFKRANQLNYDYITLVDAVDAYTGGSIAVVPNACATGLEMGDVYVAKIRNTSNYAVIQIINVVRTEHDNLDKIEFRYKK